MYFTFSFKQGLKGGGGHLINTFILPSGTILNFTILIFTHCYSKTLDKPTGTELF